MLETFRTFGRIGCWHAAALMVMFLGCASRVPFTNRMRVEYELSDEEMEQIQYYLSNEIRFERLLNPDEQETADEHKSNIGNGKSFEEITIRKGTPGIAMNVGTDYLDISLEDSTSLRFLVHGSKKEGFFYLDASWGNVVAEYDSRGGVIGHKGALDFNGKSYRVIDIGVKQSEPPYLQIDEKDLSQFPRGKRTLKGVRLR